MIKTDVIIIGGGATGTGIARDLALRGIDHCLVEKKDFAAGATGACHGLLHSGGRYVVNDPQAARECITENTILRKIGKKCVEFTEGLFVRLPGYSREYRDQFLENCEKIGISTEIFSASQTLELVPNLNPALLEAVKVPDCSIDPFRLCLLNVESSERRGGTILTHHNVIEIIKERGNCVGVNVEDMYSHEIKAIRSKIIINAAGAWGSAIAKMSGSDVPMTLSRGSLVIANHRLTDMVINHLRPSADGDIIVPNESVSLAGTTSIHVTDPDNLVIHPEEIHLITEEATHVIPEFDSVRLIRAYTGVRPLLQADSHAESDRAISRGFKIIDHNNRMFSIMGGKLTTYRLMAEKMTDTIIQHFGLQTPCTTADMPLDGQEELSGYPLSKRLKRLDNIVCECELVTQEAVEQAINRIGTKFIGDIQHRTRLGMGPCQGGFCTFRALGLMLQNGKIDSTESIEVLKNFLNSRYKGIRPVLWGDQLREEQLIEGIYLGIMGLNEE